MTDTGLENLCDRRVRQDQKGGPQVETRKLNFNWMFSNNLK